MTIREFGNTLFCFKKNSQVLNRKMFTKLILLLHFGLLTSYSSSQTNPIDSLKQVLKQAKHDTTRCQTLYRLGGWLEIDNADTALIVFKESESIARANLNKKGNEALRIIFTHLLINALNTQGYLYMTKSDTKAMYRCFSETVKLSEAINDKELMANSYINLGQYYHDISNVASSLEYFHKGLKISLDINYEEGIGSCYNSIAYVYEDQGDYVNALDYFQKSLKSHEKSGNRFGEAVALNNIGVLYKDFGDPHCKQINKECRKTALAKALKAMTGALKILKEIKDRGNYPVVMNNIGRIYQEQGDSAKAFEYAKNSLPDLEEYGNTYGVIYALQIIASYHLNKGEINKAYTNSYKAFKLADSIGQPEMIMRSAFNLGRIYKKQKKYKEALEMYELEVKMKDSLTNTSTRKAALKKQIQIEYEMKAQKDSLANEAKLLEKNLKHQQELTQQRLMSYIGLLGFLSMLIIAFVSFRAYKNKQKANVLITEQKLLAESQKQQIEISNKDLERQHLLNQKIFSVISHDFRGPMLSLSFMLDKFKQKSTDSALNNYVQEVNTEVNNANAILNNLLNWARTEINIKSLQTGSAPLNDVAHEIAAEFKTRLEDKKLTLSVSIPEATVFDLPTDILRIALRNLISNAIKFSYANTHIELSFNSNTKTIQVKDHGIGISEEKQKLLFKKEVDTGLGTANEEGFGMGLYIVSELLHKYKHNIEVESSEANGTCFKIKANNQ